MKSIATTIESQSNTGDGIDTSALCTQQVENESSMRGANSVVSQEPRARTTPPRLPRITPDIDVRRSTEAVPTSSLQSFQPVQLRKQTSLENTPSTSHSQSESGSMYQASRRRKASGENPSAASSEMPHATAPAIISDQTLGEETTSQFLGSVMAHQRMRGASPTGGKWPNAADRTEGQGNMLSLPIQPQRPYDLETMASDSEDDMAPNQVRGLYDTIFEKLVRSEFSKKDFLPQDDFEMIITKSTIKEELEEALGTFDSSLVEYIAKNARKTFATLVIQDKVSKAANLEKAKFNDDYLPISNEKSRLTSLNGLSKDRHAWKWFKSWRTQERDDFCEKQWTFLSPIFESNSMMEVLHQDCRLPFIACESQGEGGSFSLLHKAIIHHAHQTVTSVSTLVLAHLRFADSNRAIS